MSSLRVKVRHDFGKFTLNVDTSFDLQRYNVILGPSGSGKSLTLRYIAGLEPLNGSLLLNGREYSHLQPQERKIVYIPQGDSLFPHLNVKENIMFGVRHGSRKEALDIEEITRIFRIDHLLQRFPEKLSAGEKQRVTLARAIILKPSILLLDEPFSSLDFHIKIDLISFLKELKKKFSISFIHVTHDPIEAHILGEKITVMEKGKITFTGRWEELEKAPPTDFTQKIVSFRKII